MCPKSLAQGDAEKYVDMFPMLTDGKDIITVFDNFLRYLHSCAQTDIEDHLTNGKVLWEALVDTVEVILSHLSG